MTPSTITAIATPPGSGGLGVIRLSGPRSTAIAATVFRRSGQQAAPPDNDQPDHEQADLSDLASHRLYHGRIYDGDQVLDEALLVIMKAPRSYTGEDVVELHTHGGPFVLKRILALLLEHGADLAGPGEFTRRAFINGRIDLTQAEAVADIIAATSNRALSAAAAQISGSLKADVNKVRDDIMALLTEIEAAADFGDQAAPEMDGSALADTLAATALTAIDKLIARHDAVTGSPDGPRVVLAGVPNVGKSTLLNRLAGTDRAIVTSQPGTTRDLIESASMLQGRLFFIVDTAGLRKETDCEIEKEGMARARQAIDRADVVVFMVDAKAGISEQDQVVFEQVKEKPLVIAVNKADVAEEKDLGLPQQWRDAASVVNLSAKTGEGLSELETQLMAACCKADDGLSGEAVPNTRHKIQLDKARSAIQAAIEALNDGLPPDMVSIDLRAALDGLGEVVGDYVRPDVLDSIFERFCIGK